MWPLLCRGRSALWAVLIVCVLTDVALSLRFPRTLGWGRVLSQPPFASIARMHKGCILQSQPNAAILTAMDGISQSSSVDKENVDVYSHLRNEFALLSRNQHSLTFGDVSRWSEIEALVMDGVLTRDQLADLYKQASKDGSLESPLDEEAFLRLNDAIDSILFHQGVGDAEEAVEEALDEKYWETADSKTDRKGKSGSLRAASSASARQSRGGLLQDPQASHYEGELLGEFENEEGIIDDDDEDEEVDEDEDEDLIAEVDVWDPACVIEDFFESDHKRYLRDFFDTHCTRDAQGKPSLHLRSFTTSEEIKRLSKDLSLDESLYSELWEHAVSYERALASPATPSVETNGDESVNDVGIGFDSFLRLNHELEELVSHIRDAVEDLSPEEMDAYFKEEFVRLTGQKGYLTYQQLLEWEMIQELMEDDEMTRDQLHEIWKMLPKRQGDPEALPKGFGAHKEDAIDQEGFLMLSHALQELLTRQDGEDDGGHEEDQELSSSSPSSLTPTSLPPQSLLAQ